MVQDSETLVWNGEIFRPASWLIITQGEGAKMTYAQVSFLHMLPDGNIRVVDEARMYMHTIKPSQIVRVTHRDPAKA